MPGVVRGLALALLASATALPEGASASEPHAPLAAGQQQLALSLGWGRGTTIGGARGEVDETSFVDIRPRWGIGLTDRLGGEDAWQRGNLELQLSERLALTGAWRFHHISNAGRERPNLGINSSLVQIGLTGFLR